MTNDNMRDDIESLNFIVEQSGVRLDVFLSSTSGLSRNQVQRLIADGGTSVNSVARRANHKLSAGDEVSITIPPPEDYDVLPENIPLPIVYEDADIVIVNKPKGMVVHPAVGNQTGTMVHALLFHVKDLSGVGGMLRPGIVHRIDKYTSGLLVVAKNDMAHASLSAQIKAHTASRRYLAIVDGNIKADSGTVNEPIGRHPTDRKRMAIVQGGRPSVTHFRVLERFSQYTLIEARLETGRTHQIRVHMHHIKHPVSGDTVYGGERPKVGLHSQALHAWRLELTHPRTGERMAFFAPLPEEMHKALSKLGWDGEAIWEREWE